MMIGLVLALFLSLCVSKKFCVYRIEGDRHGSCSASSCKADHELRSALGSSVGQTFRADGLEQFAQFSAHGVVHFREPFALARLAQGCDGHVLHPPTGVSMRPVCNITLRLLWLRLVEPDGS